MRGSWENPKSDFIIYLSLVKSQILTMLHTILKILFPSPCYSCGFLSEPLCDKCFVKLEFCPHMRDVFGMQVCSSMYYQPGSVLEKLIHPFKYKHQAEIFRIFVAHMIEAMKILGDLDGLVFVPVPLHKKRQLDRGYNQAELLAKWTAKKLGCEMRDVLVRVKDTGSQAKVSDAASRRENMQNAFRVKEGLEKYGQIVLVDDIVTTGSTLLACREALLAAGAKKVSALTLADREKTPQNPWD